MAFSTKLDVMLKMNEMDTLIKHIEYRHLASYLESCKCLDVLTIIKLWLHHTKVTHLACIARHNKFTHLSDLLINVSLW